MADKTEKKGPKRSAEPLSDRAFEAIARLAGHRDIRVGAPFQVDLPDSGRRLWRLHGHALLTPNEPHTAALDERGLEVELDELSAIDREALLGAAPLPAGGPIPLPIPIPIPLPLPAPAPSAVTIDPPFNDLVLNPGDTLHETITVTIPKSAATPKADVYFLVDTTGSMGPNLGAVQSGAGSMLTALTGLGIDIGFGVGNYKDFLNGDPYCFQNQQPVTTTVAPVTAAIGAWSASGGGDGSEGQLFALDSLAEAPGGPIGWRTGAVRIIVWIGDAPGHDPICQAAATPPLPAAITEASATAKLVGQHIVVLAISSITGYPLGLDDDPTSNASGYVGTCTIGGLAGQATRIASATGGQAVSGINPAQLVNTIVGLVTSAVGTIKNVRLVPVGGIVPFVAAITPATGYGPLAGNVDHVLPFEVDWKEPLPCKDVEQDFSGFLDVVADGKVVAQKRVRIVIPPCQVYSYSVKYVCGSQPDCCCADAPVRPGRYATEINIYNDGEVQTRVLKRVVPLVLAGVPAGREPRTVTVKATDTIVLPAKSATMDDCHRLTELLFGGAESCAPGLNVGFLEVTSNQPLNVVAVYTATSPEGGPVSIAVESVQPRLKRGAL